MKLFITVLSSILMASFAQASECGKVTEMNFNQKNGRLMTIQIQLPKRDVTADATLSKKLFKAMETYMKSLPLGQEPAFFVCVDALGSAKIGGSKISIAEFRLWDRGEKVAQFPESKTMKQIAQEMGEYFAEDELADLLKEMGAQYKVLTDQSLTGKVKKVVESIIEQRNYYLEPQGSVYEYVVYELSKDGEVFGYILSIDDYVDHPLFSGAGVTHYFDFRVEKVQSEEWTG